MKRFSITELLISIVSTELVGAASALISGGNFGVYYGTLTKPPVAPAGFVFPIAWTILYALMGAAIYLISISDSALKSKAYAFYTAQLVINFLWSPVFFGLKSLTGGVILAVMLLILSVYTAILFFRINKISLYLFMPYVIWNTYALYLSIGFYVLN
ncbi:MAG: tryptophan-rich sensory protein [Ruminococcus sp.]|nr:tryptophan-rich sensory protein [Ruminococcus sp.]